MNYRTHDGRSSSNLYTNSKLGPLAESSKQNDTLTRNLYVFQHLNSRLCTTALNKIQDFGAAVNRGKCLFEDGGYCSQYNIFDMTIHIFYA